MRGRSVGRSQLIMIFVLMVGCIALLHLAGCVDLSIPTEKPEEPVVIEEERVPGDHMQLPDYPAGCEIVTLQNALEAFGVDLTFDETYALFDHSDSDFAYAWWGDPYTQGAAYPPAMLNAVNRALESRGYIALNISGGNLEDIFHYVIEKDGLVIVWYTTDYELPRWTDWVIDQYQMYKNEHCVLVYDIADTDAHVMDPLKGDVDIPLKDFRKIWEACGALAVAVY